MPLLRASQLQHTIGEQIVLDNAELQLDVGERVCLLGRNGSGKSTLLKMVEGSVLPDAGEIWRQPDIRIARMEQMPDYSSAEVAALTVYDVVADGQADPGALLRQFHQPARTERGS